MKRMAEGIPIGQAAGQTGISAKMIRHYEQIGLLREPERTESNYRMYSAADIDQLRFIRRARDLGFSIDMIRELSGLWQDAHRSSAEVKALTLEHIADLEKRIREMEQMRDALSKLAASCHGDNRPSCPILESIAG